MPPANHACQVGGGRANRANAQKSTGPRTEEGKQRSRLNGIRHGLTGQVSIMTDENRAAHDTYLNLGLAWTTYQVRPTRASGRAPPSARMAEMLLKI